MHLTQTELTKWAEQRIADAPKIALTYKRQGQELLDFVRDRGCDCNPSITCQTSKDGAPILTTMQMSHALGCPLK